MSNSEYAWEARNIHMRFGPTHALRGASIGILPGEIHGLIGENGAGKSTMTKVATGVHLANDGSFFLHGQPYSVTSLSETAKLGISLIFQESTVNPMLTVAENIYISKLWKYRRFGLLDSKRLNADGERQLKAVGADFSVDDDIDDLSLGQWKIIELARAIAEKPSVLFVDEATAVLDAQGKQLVMKALADLRDSGMAIGYVSHHFDEIFSLTDRVTVMRDGSNVATIVTSKSDRAEMEAKMVGRDVASSMFPSRQPKTSAEHLVTVNDVEYGDRLHGVSFSVARGEILGIAGLAGCGGAEVLRILAGDIPAAAGELRLHGTLYAPKSPRHGLQHKVAYLPGDRDGEGLVGNFSLRENIGMPSLPAPLSPVNVAWEKKTVNQYIDLLRVKANDGEQHADALSGGNRQKIVLAKLLATQPEILLLDNPTRGVDVGAREHLYAAIGNAAAAGMAVLLLSEDLPEVLGLSNRMLVMKEGTVSHEFSSMDGVREQDVIPHML